VNRSLSIRHYHVLCVEASRRLRKEDLGGATQLLQWAAELACRSSLGFYSDPGLDARLADVARQLGLQPAEDGAALAPPYRVGHVFSRLGDAGGHTRTVVNLLHHRHRDALQHAVYSTEIGDSTTGARRTLQTLGQLGVPVRRAPLGVSPLDRARWLHNQLLRDRIAAAVLHTHPHDVSAIMGVALRPVRKVFFVHHADHLYCVGQTNCDVHIDFRSTGYHFCRLHNNTREAVLIPPCAHSLMEAKRVVPLSRDQLGVPANCLLTATVGSAGKLLPQPGLDYFQALREIMRAHPEMHHLLIGPGCAESLRPLVQALPEVAARIHTWGPRTDILAVLKAIDFYLDSFPIGGGLTSMEVMSLAKPIVSLLNPHYCLLSTGGMLGRYRYQVGSVADYVNAARELATAPEQRRAAGQQLRAFFQRNYDGPFVARCYEDLIAHHLAPPPHPILKIHPLQQEGPPAALPVEVDYVFGLALGKALVPEVPPAFLELAWQATENGARRRLSLRQLLLAMRAGETGPLDPRIWRLAAKTICGPALTRLYRRGRASLASHQPTTARPPPPTVSS